VGGRKRPRSKWAAEEKGGREFPNLDQVDGTLCSGTVTRGRGKKSKVTRDHHGPLEKLVPVEKGGYCSVGGGQRRRRWGRGKSRLRETMILP